MKQFFNKLTTSIKKLFTKCKESENNKKIKLPEGVMLTVYIVIIDSMLVLGLIALFVSKVLRG